MRLVSCPRDSMIPVMGLQLLDNPFTQEWIETCGPIGLGSRQVYGVPAGSRGAGGGRTRKQMNTN